MVRNRSGPTTSTMWPIARSSCTTVFKVRTTPLTCGSHASVTIMIRWSCPGGSMLALPDKAVLSDRFAHLHLTRGEERQPVHRSPVDQFQPPVMVFDQRRAALHPVTVVQIQHTLPFAHLGVVNVAADDTVEAAGTRLGGQRGLEPVDR